MGKVLPIANRVALKIGDLAKLAGKSARALRLYEDLGLLGPTIRTEGGHRMYAEEALVRLRWIDKLQLLGFSLHEIRKFLDHLEDDHLGPLAMERVRHTFASKLEEVRAQIKGLETLAAELADSLQYLSTCKTCETSTLFDQCGGCAYEHDIDAPVLITGIHKGGESKS
jgi:DNA-binding transcriptional MerR regulator